jgi:hypothetical protein
MISDETSEVVSKIRNFAFASLAGGTVVMSR